MIASEYFKKCYDNKLENQEEIEKFLDQDDSQTLNQQYMTSK